MAFAFIPELVTIELGSAVQELANDAFEGSQSLSSFEYCGSVVNVLATLNSTGATRTTLSCSQGPKGDQGNAGPQGPQGEKGEKGDSGEATPPVLAAQTVKAIAKTLKLKKSLVLPAKTIQGTAIVWVSKTPKICSVSKGKLVAKKVKGTCSVQATAAAKTGYKALTKLVKVSIK